MNVEKINEILSAMKAKVFNLCIFASTFFNSKSENVKFEVKYSVNVKCTYMTNI